MHNDHKLFLIAAADKKRGIGKACTLPWQLKKELAHFTRISRNTDDPTKQNMAIMGQGTWLSLPEKFRPLPDRKNVVLSLDEDFDAPGAVIARSLEEALDMADETIESLYICGGGYTYKHSIDHEDVDGIYLTEIDYDFGCDTFFPDIPDAFSKRELLGSDSEDGISFEYILYSK